MSFTNFKKIWLSNFSFWKFFSVTIIAICFLFVKPEKTNAQWLTFDAPHTAVGTVSAISNPVTSFVTTPISATSDVIGTAKETVGDALAFYAVDMVLKTLTAQTVNWINSGFRGNPAYVTNPQRFFRNLGDQVANQFLGEQLNQLCTPFQMNVRLALVKNYLQEAQPPSCTIDRVIGNYEAFLNNFENGGWTGWFALTETSSNNPFGAYNQASDSMLLQINSAKEVKQQDLTQGRGFLSFQRCKVRAGSVESQTDNETGEPLSSAGEVKRECLRRAVISDYNPETKMIEPFGVDDINPETGNPWRAGECIDYRILTRDSNGNWLDVDDNNETVPEGECAEKETVTPGSVIEGQLQKVFGSSVDRLGVADELNEVVSALLQQFMKKAMSSVGNGLRGLSQKQSGETESFTQGAIRVGDASNPSPAYLEERNNLENALESGIPPQAQEFIMPTNQTSQDYIDEDAIEANVNAQEQEFNQRVENREIGDLEAIPVRIITPTPTGIDPIPPVIDTSDSGI